MISLQSYSLSTQPKFGTNFIINKPGNRHWATYNLPKAEQQDEIKSRTQAGEKFMKLFQSRMDAPENALYKLILSAPYTKEITYVLDPKGQGEVRCGGRLFWSDGSDSTLHEGILRDTQISIDTFIQDCALRNLSMDTARPTDNVLSHIRASFAEPELPQEHRSWDVTYYLKEALKRWKDTIENTQAILGFHPETTKAVNREEAGELTFLMNPEAQGISIRFEPDGEGNNTEGNYINLKFKYNLTMPDGTTVDNAGTFQPYDNGLYDKRVVSAFYRNIGQQVARNLFENNRIPEGRLTIRHEESEHRNMAHLRRDKATS
jgi:hypothetical protein